MRCEIRDIKYAVETIWCSCGAVITARPDAALPDRHEPLDLAYRKHRAEVSGRPEPRPRRGKPLTIVGPRGP